MLHHAQFFWDNCWSGLNIAHYPVQLEGCAS